MGRGLDGELDERVGAPMSNVDSSPGQSILRSERSRLSHSATRPPSPLSTFLYNELRRRYVLIEYDPNGALCALLRFGGVDEHRTRHCLRELLFQPNASPARAPISLKRDVSGHELGMVCAQLREALGEAAVLDMGASFSDDGRAALRNAKSATFWPGSFLVHVGGTRRCVVFEADVDERALAQILSRTRDDYYQTEFRPVTE